MKKFLSVIMITVFMLNMLPILATAASTSSTSDDVAQGFVLAADIMPMYTELDFVRRTVVKRGEFAAILCNIDKSLALSTTTKFSDVDAKYEFAKEIAAVCEVGYMEAYDGLFYPNGTVLASDVVRAVVLMSGYGFLAEQHGGGAQGYRMVAIQTGILKALKLSGDEVITVNTLSQMIYDCLEIEVSIIDNISSDGNATHTSSEENTFMKDVMKLFKAKGVVTDNGYTALAGDSAAGKYSVIVDGTQYYLPQKAEGIRNCLGRNVEIYYTEDENSAYPTIQFYIDNIDTKVEFEIGEFEKLDGRTITFYDEDADKEYEYTLKAAPNIIYNGKAEDALREEFFEGDNGTVVLSKAKGESAYNTIIIESYVSWYITNYDLQNNVLYTYSQFKSVEGKHSLKLDEENGNVFIYDTYGTLTTDNQLYNYIVVDVLKNDDFVKIKIAPRGVFSVKIDKVKANDGVITYISGENQYVTTKAFAANAEFFKPAIGDACNLYFNSFGEVVYAELEAADVLKVGYAVAGGDYGSELAADYKVQIFSSNGVLAILDCADKVSVVDRNQTKTVYKEAQLKNKFSVRNELVQYKLNAEGEINFIGLAAGIGTKREEGALGMIFKGHGYHSMNSGTINAQVSLGETQTKIFIIDESQSKDELKYTVVTPSQKGDMKLSYSAYNTVEGSMYAEYILVNENVSAANSSKNVIFIENFGKKIVDEDEVFFISAYDSRGNLKEYTVEDEDFYTNIKGLLDDGSSTYSIEVGDWLMASVDSNNRVNDYLKLFYRPSIPHPLNPDGKKGYVVNNIGYFDIENTNLSNPFYEGGGNANVPVTSFEDIFNSSMTTSYKRWIVGYVLSVDKFGGIVYTTQDLSAETYNPDDTRFISEARMLPSFVTINYSNHKMSVAAGMPGDILDYKTVGKECSKILIKSTTGRLEGAYIVNGEMD